MLKPIWGCQQPANARELMSMQVVLAEDTLQPACPLVAIKIMKRQHAYIGQKASLLSFCEKSGPSRYQASLRLAFC